VDTLLQGIGDDAALPDDDDDDEEDDDDEKWCVSVSPSSHGVTSHHLFYHDAVDQW
jgi:hypothetical protein